MRIAYVAHVDFFKKKWCLDKIERQVAVASRKHDVKKCFFHRSMGNSPKVQGSLFTYDFTIGQISVGFNLFRELKLWQPDVIYFRYSTAIPPMYLFPQIAPTVVEINGHDDFEIRGKSYPLRMGITNGHSGSEAKYPIVALRRVGC